MKQCSVCDKLLELSSFPKRTSLQTSKKAQCKKCVAEYKAKLYKKNEAVEKEKRRNNYKIKQEYYRDKARIHYRNNSKESNFKRRLKKYGITEKQYYELFEKQNKCCAICKSSNSSKDYAIHHCHNTGIVRGILCDNCNTGIGLLKEDIEIINSAVMYLKKYKK